jgi:hypothetical protein
MLQCGQDCLAWRRFFALLYAVCKTGFTLPGLRVEPIRADSDIYYKWNGQGGG